jgi:hypothetical protein
MTEDEHYIRDIVIRTETKIDNHITEDMRIHEAIFRAFEVIRADLKKQNWILALIIGGFIALSKLPDLLSVVHAATR